MKDRDERFWAALTTRVDAARRADRSEQEELAEAERFLQATEDESLRPELVDEVVDEVSGKREARQVATLPVGANLDRRWRVGRTAAAALIGSVLVLGGYAAMEFIASEHEANPELRRTKSNLDFPDAVSILENPSQGEKRLSAASQIADVVLGCAKSIDAIADSDDRLSEVASEHLSSLLTEETEGSALPIALVREQTEALTRESQLASRRQALEVLATQAGIGLTALRRATRESPEFRPLYTTLTAEVSSLVKAR